MTLTGCDCILCCVFSKFPVTDDTTELHIDWQRPGDVYVSTPYAFSHGVEYVGCSWDDRIIAVQFRFLLTQQVFRQLRQARRQLEFAIRAVTTAMEAGNVLMPSLEEVRAVEAEIVDN